MVFKHIGRKIRYAKLLKANRSAPFWVSLKKFGRLTILYKNFGKRSWRHDRVSL